MLDDFGRFWSRIRFVQNVSDLYCVLRIGYHSCCCQLPSVGISFTVEIRNIFAVCCRHCSVFGMKLHRSDVVGHQEECRVQIHERGPFSQVAPLFHYPNTPHNSYPSRCLEWLNDKSANTAHQIEINYMIKLLEQLEYEELTEQEQQDFSEVLQGCLRCLSQSLTAPVNRTCLPLQMLIWRAF